MKRAVCPILLILLLLSGCGAKDFSASSSPSAVTSSRPTESSDAADTQSYGHYEYLYDDSSNVIAETWFNELGEKEFYNEYKYDKHGNQIRCDMYNRDGNYESGWTAEYDERGLMVKYTELEADGGIDTTYVYHYDDEGNMIDFEMFDGQGNPV